MTSRTVGTQRAFMHIFMACLAIFSFYPQPILKNSQRRGAYLMAFLAVYLFVFAFQGKMGLIVVKPV